MKGAIDNLQYQRMLLAKSITDRIEYLSLILDFYYEVMIALRKVGFSSAFRAQMSCSVQMMFTKGKAMQSLLNGFSHNNDIVSLKSQADHTILFTLVRAALEQLLAFELVYMIPDTEEKRIIMENIYIAAGQVNRLNMFTEEALENNKYYVEKLRKEIEDCKKLIHETQFYQSLTEKEKSELDKRVFMRGEFQIVLSEEGKKINHVGWDEVRNYCKLSTDALHGVYKYACSMAHPSYLGLCQFYDAYRDGEIKKLNDTAVMQMISVMSVFIMDFLESFPEVRHVYKDLDEETQFMIRMYSIMFRNHSLK